MEEKGVVLLGEAAKLYVYYKCFDSVLVFITVFLGGWLIWRLFKKYSIGED
ncbi:MAG TPA: hypothetical protein ACFYD4_14580 [Candidatus Wunengus sp. YC61]|uniref:hypothetical protein n=1 Tax=Candidatus Wunengus sp. YC61 TaxID=3367698 RepID=UPI004028FE55